MRINCTLSLGLDVFLFVTADNHRSAPHRLRHITEMGQTMREIGGRVSQIGEKVKDSAGGKKGRVKDSKIEEQSA